MAGVFPTAILLAGLWWVLTDGSAGSWLIGLPALASAVWVHRRLNAGPRVRVSPAVMLRFVPYFLWQSLRGGVDVALRTLAPRLRVRPGFCRYRISLDTLPARVFFVNCLSLLPGTLAADLEGEWVEVHALNTGLDLRSELARLERMVAALFGDSRCSQ